MRSEPLPSPVTIAQAEMRNINRSAVLEFLRRVQTTSRTEMAASLQISLPSISRIVDELIAAGLVRATGRIERGRGRGRELLQLDSDGNLVIGIDLGGSHISGALVSLDGRLVHEERDSSNAGDAETNYRRLAAFLQTLLDQATKISSARILGAAIGVPGILDSQTGLVRLAPGLDWVDFPLLQRLEKDFSLPILLENDVNLAALGEHWFGAGRGVRHLVMVAIGTGIGAGIILNGVLHRGHAEASGEIGYILPGVQYLGRPYPGFGALESVASGRGISEQAARKWIELHGRLELPDTDAAAVFQAARRREPWAVQVIDETVDHLSLALGNLIAVLDPELVILGGGIAGSAGMLIEPIRARLSGVLPRLPRIEEAQLGERAAIYGAVVRVFQKHTGYAAVQTG